jgi:hypothetical protein
VKMDDDDNDCVLPSTPPQGHPLPTLQFASPAAPSACSSIASFVPDERGPPRMGFTEGAPPFDMSQFASPKAYVPETPIICTTSIMCQDRKGDLADYTGPPIVFKLKIKLAPDKSKRNVPNPLVSLGLTPTERGKKAKATRRSGISVGGKTARKVD